MPSVSAKQKRFMAAAAHSAAFAASAGIKQSVAREFNQADSGSGHMKKTDKKAGKPGKKGNPFKKAADKAVDVYKK